MVPLNWVISRYAPACLMLRFALMPGCEVWAMLQLLRGVCATDGGRHVM